MYSKILGEERAENISPLRSAEKLGVKIGIHNDSPSSGPNVLFFIYKEEIKKGIAKGMVADLLELDRNPLEVDPDDIKSIHVLQTIKHGK